MSIIIITLVAVVISFFDIKTLTQKKKNKEVIVYVIFMLAAIGLAIWYQMNMYGTSIAGMMLGLMKAKG